MQRTVTMSAEEYSQLENTIISLTEENKKLIKGAFTVYSNGRDMRLVNTPEAVTKVNERLETLITEAANYKHAAKVALNQTEVSHLTKELSDARFEIGKLKRENNRYLDELTKPKQEIFKKVENLSFLEKLINLFKPL